MTSISAVRLYKTGAQAGTQVPALADNARNMRVKIIAGRITAEAETAEDMQTILAYAKNTPTGVQAGRKHKKACPKCGKRVKYMEAHNTVMHGAGRLLGAVRGDMAHSVPIERVI